MSVNDSLPSGEQSIDCFERLVQFAWVRAQKRKIVAAKKAKSKENRGKEKAARDVDRYHENDDLGTEDVPDDECSPMPETCVPPNMRVFALWGPFCDAPEVEFSMPASTGPRKRRPRDEVQGGEGIEGGEGGEGSGGDDKRAAVTCPNTNKKLGETGGILSRREISKRKKEDKQELKKRRKAADEARSQIAPPVGILANMGNSLDQRIQNLLVLRESEARVSALRQTLALYKSIGDDGMIAETTRDLLQELRALATRKSEHTGCLPVKAPGVTGAGSGDDIGNSNDSMPVSTVGGGGEGGGGGVIGGGGGGDSGSNNRAVTDGSSNNNVDGGAGSGVTDSSNGGDNNDSMADSSDGCGGDDTGSDIAGGGGDPESARSEMAGGYSDNDVCGDADGCVLDGSGRGSGTGGTRGGAGATAFSQGAGAGGGEVVRLDAGSDDDVDDGGDICSDGSSSIARIRSMIACVDDTDEGFEFLVV